MSEETLYKSNRQKKIEERQALQLDALIASAIRKQRTAGLRPRFKQQDFNQYWTTQ